MQKKGKDEERCEIMKGFVKEYVKMTHQEIHISFIANGLTS